MSLNHVILGLLNQESMTGYEIKKIIQNTPFMHWSGNNNQIYKAFVELLDKGFVTKEVQHHEGSPSKNIYTITNSGINELKDWLISDTEEPAFKKQILIKLAFACQLKRSALEKMLASYLDTVKMQAILAEKELDKCYFAEKEPSNKAKFLSLIRENILSFYSYELEWIRKVQDYISELPDDESISTESKVLKENKEVKSDMNYKVIENQGKKYIHFTSKDPLIQSEHDAYNIITLCFENDANAVLLEGNSLSDDFVNLKTGIAGTVLQKLGNYNVKAAVILKDNHNFTPRFKEMALEHSKGNSFRVFTNMNEAVSWLLA